MLYCPISNWRHFYLQNKTADDICKMEKHHNNTAESKETHYNVKRRCFKNGSGTDWIFAAHHAAWDAAAAAARCVLHSINQ